MYFYFVSVGRSENDDNCFTYMYRVTIIEGNIYTMGGDDPTIIQGNIYTMGGGDPAKSMLELRRLLGSNSSFLYKIPHQFQNIIYNN